MSCVEFDGTGQPADARCRQGGRDLTAVLCAVFDNGANRQRGIECVSIAGSRRHAEGTLVSVDERSNGPVAFVGVEPWRQHRSP